jgi:hypothetical protein
MYNPYIDATVFMVLVRDPFLRAVSEAAFKALEKRKLCLSNATWLNEVIAFQLERADEPHPHKSDNHWVPRHEFLRIHQHDDEEKPYILKSLKA